MSSRPNPATPTLAQSCRHASETVASHLSGEHVSIYVPTTPNPTGGYFVIVPRTSVRELDMSVDEALKYIISMGVVSPRTRASPRTDAALRSLASIVLPVRGLI